MNSKILMSLTSIIQISAILLYGCTGETITEKGGHLNLGIPGIMSVGAAIGVLTEYLLGLMGLNVPFLVVIIPIITTFIGAGIVGLLYSFLTVTLRCNQNVTGLTITTFGVGLTGVIIEPIKVKSATIISRFSKYFRKLFPFAANMGDFGKIFFSYGILVYLAIAIAIVTQIVLNRTKIGLHLRAVGENPATADAAGINVAKYKYFSTIIGSGIAGLGGLCCIMDYLSGSWGYIMEVFGWLAVALVIFTLWRPVLAILGSIVFGGLYMLTSYIDVPFAFNELIRLAPYLVTIIVLIVTSIIGKKEAQPPAALGTNYFREER